MIDREKVIKGLELCIMDMNRSDSMPCRSCPYGSLPKRENCQKRLFADALAMLKEQGKLKSSMPTLIKNDKDQNEYWLICGFCKHKIDALFRFCPYCGREIELT